VEGLWLRAQQQSGGKGRMGRDWISPPGNLYCSTVIDIREPDPSPSSLSFVCALALHDSIAAYVPPAAIVLKWPNDLLLDGAKLSGILLERVGEQVIAGIGVNIASAPELPDRKAAALNDFATAPVDPAILFTVLAARLAERLQQWRRDGLAATLADWQARSHALGTTLAVRLATGEQESGAFAGLASDGGLRLRKPGGALITIYAGDVALLGERGE
jgi:BirA family biotin operon repressor/biotin-[acetyl-CoA-carboxylase] ligase